MDKDNLEIIEKIKTNSIGNEKKEKLKAGFKKISKKAAATLVVMLMVVSFAACKKVDRIDRVSLDNYIASLARRAEVDLIIYDIDYFDYDTKEPISNSVEDFKKIKTLSEDNLIGYYEFLGYEECEKVVQALGYEGWDDFLTKKNCFDKEGNPSIEEWERQTEEYLYYHDIMGESDYEHRSRSN